MKYVAEKFTVRVLAAAAVVGLSVSYSDIKVSAKEYNSSGTVKTAQAKQSSAKSTEKPAQETKKLSKKEKESEEFLKTLGYDSLYSDTSEEQDKGDGSDAQDFDDPYNDYFDFGDFKIDDGDKDEDYMHMDTFVNYYPDDTDTENSSDFGDFDKKELAMIWPVPTVRSITDGFGYRYVKETGKTAFHKGIDINRIGCKGEEIIAAADGVVTTASNTYNGYGIHVVIEHNDGHTSTLYGHMCETTVSVGDEVKQGDVIGYIGNTGEAYGYHCHFEVRVDDEPVDPMDYVSEEN